MYVKKTATSCLLNMSVGFWLCLFIIKRKIILILLKLVIKQYLVPQNYIIDFFVVITS